MDSAAQLTFSRVTGRALAAPERAEVLALLSAAFRTDYVPFLTSFVDPVHLLARRGEELVSHALWIPRRLEHATAGPLHTAYVEAVATAPAHQGRGYGAAIMRKLAAELRAEPAYELAALGAAAPAFYERLGWRRWRGPRGVRTSTGVELTPEAPVMILPLPATPPLDETALLTVAWRAPEPW
jgi:GNAT superfamily N-acetyltransferase